MQAIVLTTYRNREAHLKEWVPAMRIAVPGAKIYVIEQADDKSFNRGKLFNVGFLHTEQLGDYWIMQDVDLLPLSVDYSYPDKPTHLATQASQFGYKMPFDKYFGGCNAFTREQFRAVNGFSNHFRGWGAEDCELLKQFEDKGIEIQRRPGRFKSLPHKRVVDKIEYSQNLELFKGQRPEQDGLDHCDHEIIGEEQKEGYTLVKVHL